MNENTGDMMLVIGGSIGIFAGLVNFIRVLFKKNITGWDYYQSITVLLISPIAGMALLAIIVPFAICSSPFILIWYIRKLFIKNS